MAVRTGPQPMPGMFPQMPGIMGAPMGPPPGMPGMGGMPGMPPMPMGAMPPPMPMGGPMGGPAPQVQGGGRPASLGTLPAPSTAEQRAGFGAAVGAVAGMPVQGAMPADVFAGGIPGGMMDGSIPRPVARMREGGAVQYMQAGGAPFTVEGMIGEMQKVDPSIKNITDFYRAYGAALRSGDIPLMNALMNAQSRGVGRPESVDPYAETMAVVRETPGYAAIKSSLGPDVQLKADYGISDIDAYNQEFFGTQAKPVNPYDAVNAYYDRGILDEQKGFYENELDVLRNQLSDLQAAYAGPRYTGVLDPASYGMPEGASYQPTLGSIPTFTLGVSDVFGTRPVTYYGSPQAAITSGIGSINLPARPESVNVFDWLASPVSGVGLYRPGSAS